MYIYEIKGFHQNENLERVLSFYADNGEVEYITGFDGCLLDNYLYSCGAGIAAVYEIFVNTNMSGYKVVFSEDPKEIEEIYNTFYERETVYYDELDRKEREYKEKHCKKVVKAVKAVTVYNDFPFFKCTDDNCIYTHNMLFKLFLEYKKTEEDPRTYEQMLRDLITTEYMLIPAKRIYARIAED